MQMLSGFASLTQVKSVDFKRHYMGCDRHPSVGLPS